MAKSLLIIDGKEKILIDTGIGGVPEGSQYDALRKTMKITRTRTQGTKHQLAELGIKPGEITAVVNTHLHNAHCGCNYLSPDAQFYISREEFRAIDDPLGEDPNQTAYIDQNFEKLKNVNNVKGEYKVTENVTIVPTPGHTRGHQSVVVKLKNYNLIYSGDVSPEGESRHQDAHDRLRQEDDQGTDEEAAESGERKVDIQPRQLSAQPAAGVRRREMRSGPRLLRND